VFRAMGVPLARVLEGIAAAHEAGLWPVKLNTVVERGVNDHGLVDLARFAHATAWSCGSSTTWTWARPRLAPGRRRPRRRGHPPHRRRAAALSGRLTVPSSRIRRLLAYRPGLGLPWSTILLPTYVGSRVDLLVPVPPRQAGGAGGDLVEQAEGPPHRRRLSADLLGGHSRSQAVTATPLAGTTAGRRRWRGARRRTAQRSGAGVRSAWPPRR
jgi:hypothetical protein